MGWHDLPVHSLVRPSIHNITLMSLLGKQIQLKGLSQKGKNRVREHGDRWMVLAETERVIFAPGEVGPWVFIRSEERR